jgi:excisionase family DNA binding protein
MYNIILFYIASYNKYKAQWREVMENDLVLTTEEAAEFLKLTPFTVRDYARRRILPARKVGKGWRFYKPDLVAWLRDYQAPI